MQFPGRSPRMTSPERRKLPLHAHMPDLDDFFDLLERVHAEHALRIALSAAKKGWAFPAAGPIDNHEGEARTRAWRQELPSLRGKHFLFLVKSLKTATIGWVFHAGHLQ